MTRFAPFMLSLLLAVSLMLAAGVGGALRTDHAIAESGLETIVICGSEGAETVTLNREGAPVSPATDQCPHCADCTLTPIAALAPVPGVPMSRGFSFVSYRLSEDHQMRLTTRVENPSRGPPIRNEILWT